MRITAIQTYPIKGMSALKKNSACLQAGKILADDRIYAVLPETPDSAGHFEAAPDSPNDTSRCLTLSRNPRLGELQSRFTPEIRLLELCRQGETLASGRLNRPQERAQIEEFLTGHMGDSIQGRLRIVEREGKDFSYKGHAHCLSLINLASIAALERAVGRAIDPGRFRANIYFQGREPWEEFAWVGDSLRLGEQARCLVREPIERCAAIDVDPATGARDMSLVRALLDNFSHRDLGIYVRVQEGGDIAVGEEVQPLPGA